MGEGTEGGRERHDRGPARFWIVFSNALNQSQNPICGSPHWIESLAETEIITDLSFVSIFLLLSSHFRNLRE